MIKLYIPNISKQEPIGGGWSFLRNLKKALSGMVEFVDTWIECDIYLITSVTLVDKNEVFEAHRAGKKIVLRVDNMPRKSRNSRMSPHERMKEFAQLGSVIYQSKWAQEWIGGYVGVAGTVIYNGVDTGIFKPIKKEKGKVYLVVQYNRDENKRIPEAFDWFTKEWIKDKESKLLIAGRFSPDLVEAGFDFFRGEPVTYVGVQETPEQMAEIMHKADILLYPSYSDACPNTVIEAKACGLDVWHNGHAGVGEAASIEDVSLERMGLEYLHLFKKCLGTT